MRALIVSKCRVPARRRWSGQGRGDAALGFVHCAVMLMPGQHRQFVTRLEA